MATTYTSQAAQSTSPARQVSEAGVHMTAYGEYTLTAAAELGTINNVIEMVKVPAGARIVSMTWEIPDNDSGTSFTLDIGDGGDTDRFVAAATTGQSAGFGVTSGMVAASALGYQYTAADTIDFLVHAAPAGSAATSGKIKLIVGYVIGQ